MGVLMGVTAWYANIFYVIVLLTLLNDKLWATLIFTFLIVMLMLTIPVFFGSTIPLDESGFNSLIPQRLGIGGYLWIVSLLLPGLFAIIYLRKEASAKAQAQAKQSIVAPAQKTDEEKLTR